LSSSPVRETGRILVRRSEFPIAESALCEYDHLIRLVFRFFLTIVRFASTRMNTRPRTGIPSWVPTPSRLAGLAWSARVALAVGGLPTIALYFNGGLGDHIMCSAVARELRRRGTKTVWQLTPFAEVFTGNSDVVAVPADFRLHRLCALLGIPCVDLEYPSPPATHLIADMCAKVGIRGVVDLRPRVLLSDAERGEGKVVSRSQIAIQTSSSAARYPMQNKQWPHERFQVVADALKAEFDLVQLGAASDPALRDVLDLRGKTTVRQSAAILSQSQVFIGLVSGVMHLARAVECRSVIVYGGRENPSQSGYSANENLHWNGPCAPCWLRNDCDFDRRCMSEILPEHVIAASRRQVELFGTPLAVDRVEIP
jgi:hypothetical protein